MVKHITMIMDSVHAGMCAERERGRERERERECMRGYFSWGKLNSTDDTFAIPPEVLCGMKEGDLCLFYICLRL